MKIIIGSDHGGYNLKEHIKSVMTDKGHQVEDLGPDSIASTDYPDYALKLARAVARGDFERGVLICGTGLGMSMAANRIPGVRAALCANEYMARMSREHNNANVLCMGERVIGIGLAESILNTWLETDYPGDERHQRRLGKFDRICE